MRRNVDRFRESSSRRCGRYEVALRRFDYFASLDKEPSERVPPLGPEASVSYKLAVFVLRFLEAQLLLKQRGDEKFLLEQVAQLFLLAIPPVFLRLD